ncbi:MAG: hypothetical protein NTY53_23615 [Kiritimatiellaeota bacterium]|nr:hypothetical protein [Kiritimatiellota bacterium]
MPVNEAIANSAAACGAATPINCGYYDSGRQQFWFENSEGIWQAHAERAFKRILIGQGLKAKAEAGEVLSQVESTLLQVQNTRAVAYAGPLAGWQAGAQVIAGRRILATCGPRLITPVAGECLHLLRFFETLFHPHPQQQPVFFGWLKIAVEALSRHQFRPGQAIAMAGARDNGKSLCQLLVTEMLGGRFARAYDYLSGRTQFNSDLVGAEHLMIEDDVPSTRIEDRRRWGAAIKTITACEGQRLHAKFCDPLTLPVFWRLTITMNQEPENLMILPPLDESLADKLTLLLTAVAELPCSTQTIEGRQQCWNTLTGELPAFLAHLQAWQIPEELRACRYGVRAFQHPDLVRTLAELSPENKLEVLIDAVLFGPAATRREWEGSATQLEHLLRESDEYRSDTQRLLTFNTAAGVYLGRLATHDPTRYQTRHTEAGNIWTIRAPEPPGTVDLTAEVTAQ